MIRSTKYSLGVSYLAGIVQSAVQPFSARSRTAKLLGINPINQRSRCRPSRHHDLLSFPYLSRPLELYADESATSDHNLNPVLNMSIESASQKVFQSKKITVDDRTKELLASKSESAAPEFALERESHRTDENGAKEQRRKEMDASTAQYFKPGPLGGDNEVPERLSRKSNDVRTDSGAEDRQSNVSGVNNLKRRDGKSVSYKIPNEDGSVISSEAIAYLSDKSMTMCKAKPDLMANLGRLLEANNFPEAQEKPDDRQHEQKNTSDADCGDKQYERVKDQMADRLKTPADTKMQRQRLETLKLKFQDQHYKDNEVQAIRAANKFQPQESMSSIETNQESAKRYPKAVVGKPIEGEIHRKSLPSMKQKDHVSEPDRPVDLYEKEAKAVSENKKEIRRQTIYVERKSSVSTSTELPQAFWERSYLGRANLRLYK